MEDEGVGRQTAGHQRAQEGEAPGIGTTGILCRIANDTNRKPGSETPGIPASVTRAIE